MSNLVQHRNRLASHVSDHPVRSGVTISGMVILVLAAIGVIWLMPGMTRYIRMVRM